MLLKFLFLILGLLSIINCSILLPVYLTGEYRDLNIEFFAKTTLVSLRKDESRVWAAFIMTLVNAIAIEIAVLMYWM